MNRLPRRRSILIGNLQFLYSIDNYVLENIMIIVLLLDGFHRNINLVRGFRIDNDKWFLRCQHLCRQCWNHKARNLFSTSSSSSSASALVYWWQHNEMEKSIDLTYIRSDPYLSPIASNFWTGSKASAVGLCGKPWRNVCKRDSRRKREILALSSKF